MYTPSRLHTLFNFDCECKTFTWIGVFSTWLYRYDYLSKGFEYLNYKTKLMLQSFHIKLFGANLR